MSLTLLFTDLIKKHKGLVLLVIIISSLVILSAVGLFTTSSYIIAYCGITPSVAEIMIPVVGVRFFGLARGILRYIERMISHDSTFRLLSDLRNSLYNKISDAKISQILALDKEDAFTRLVDDIERLQEFYLRTFNPYITAIIIGLFGSVFLYQFSFSIALTFVIFYSLATLVMPILLYNATKGLFHSLVNKSSESKMLHLEILAGLTDIIISGSLVTWTVKINNHWKSVYKIEKKLAFWKSLSTALINLFMMLALIIGVCLAGVYILDRGFNPVFVPVVAYGIFSLFEGAQPVAVILQKIEESRISAQRIDEITRKLKSDNFEEIIIKGQETVFENVEYKYRQAKEPVLKDINIRLNKNKKIALVGASGQGKTTLSYLLLGWLQPTKGRITYKASPCDLFSVVNQQVYFFNTSILNNLRVANNQASIEEIRQVLEAVQLKEFIESLPQGLEYELGDGDIKLSGGQKQRLAIARALLRHTPYLIFDEITQGLDSETENKLMKILLYELKDRGLIVLTHRLIQMEAYDEILVLNQGKIKERGSHKELMNQNGDYAHSYRLQQSYVEFS